MGIRSVPERIRPAPKAACPRCRRPVAVIKAGRCSYCGAVLDLVLATRTPAPTLPPEALIALEPRGSAASSRTAWIRRMVALGAAVTLVALFTGTCMRS